MVPARRSVRKLRPPPVAVASGGRLRPVGGLLPLNLAVAEGGESGGEGGEGGESGESGESGDSDDDGIDDNPSPSDLQEGVLR